MKGIVLALIGALCFGSGFAAGLVSAINRAAEPFQTRMTVLPDTTRCAVVTQGAREVAIDCDWRWRDPLPERSK